MIRRFACIVWFILFATPVAAAGLMKTGADFHPTSVALSVVMLQNPPLHLHCHALRSWLNRSNKFAGDEPPSPPCHRRAAARFADFRANLLAHAQTASAKVY